MKSFPDHPSPPPQHYISLAQNTYHISHWPPSAHFQMTPTHIHFIFFHKPSPAQFYFGFPFPCEDKKWNSPCNVYSECLQWVTPCRLMIYVERHTSHVFLPLTMTNWLIFLITFIYIIYDRFLQYPLLWNKYFITQYATFINYDVRLLCPHIHKNQVYSRTIC